MRFAVRGRRFRRNIVDSCGRCASSLDSEESYCEQDPTLTCGGPDRHDGSRTFGAYSSEYVVRDAFVYALPEGLDPAGVAPLMCAGITVWQRCVGSGVGPGTRVGVIGLGGLGHLAVKSAKGLGASVAVVTTSSSRTDDALALGADDVVVSTEPAAIAAHDKRFDVILDTASSQHDLTPYVQASDMDGTLCMLGIPDTYEVSAIAMLLGRHRLTASGSGGTRDTQEMPDFAAAHGITADVEVLPAEQAQVALDRLAANDVRWRFVLDAT